MGSPRIGLVFHSGSAIKRITAGVKAAADRRCQVSIWGPAFTLPVKSVSNENRILLSSVRRCPSRPRHWPVIMRFPSTLPRSANFWIARHSEQSRE